MTVLFLTNLLPYPLDNGGKIKTFSTLYNLQRAGNLIDLVCYRETNNLCNTEESKILTICRSIKQVFQKLTTAENKKYMAGLALKSMFTKYPLSIYKYISEELVGYLQSKKNEEYDLVYFDHLPMYVFHDLCKRLWPKAKVILDEHNCETAILKRNAELQKNQILKTYLQIEAKKMSDFESAAVLSADKTIMLSKEDYRILRDIAGKDFNHAIIPIGISDRKIKKTKDKISGTLDVLFVGTMTWEPNNQGLLWFVENVIPLLEKEKVLYHLYVVGKNPSKEIISKGEQNKNIIITGYVESVDEYYDLCDCAIVPLFIGSGQRVKLIEAFSKAMPAISTIIGAEGLVYKDGETVLIANNANEFVSSIKAIANEEFRKHIGQEARKVYERYYSVDAVGNMLVKAIAS